LYCITTIIRAENKKYFITCIGDNATGFATGSILKIFSELNTDKAYKFLVPSIYKQGATFTAELGKGMVN